jgi:hypothetical protein
MAADQNSRQTDCQAEDNARATIDPSKIEDHYDSVTSVFR